jgi:hypothetical protein
MAAAGLMLKWVTLYKLSFILLDLALILSEKFWCHKKFNGNFRVSGCARGKVTYEYRK